MSFTIRVTFAVLATIGVGLAASLEAVDATTCDAKTRAANLTFTLADVDGRDVALSAYKGKVILLDFWATWCGPCKTQIPIFVELFTRYQARGFVVLGVSVNDPASKLKPFMADFKMNYPVLIGAGRDDVLEGFGPMAAFPTAFLIARDGTICRKHIGLTPKDALEREVKALL